MEIFTTLTHMSMPSFMCHSLKPCTAINTFVECSIEIFRNIHQLLDSCLQCQFVTAVSIYKLCDS